MKKSKRNLIFSIAAWSAVLIGSAAIFCYLYFTYHDNLCAYNHLVKDKSEWNQTQMIIEWNNIKTQWSQNLWSYLVISTVSLAITGFYAFIIARQQKELEAKQADLNDAFSRLKETEFWAINLRKKYHLQILLFKDQILPENLKSMFDETNENRSFMNVTTTSIQSIESLASKVKPRTDIVIFINDKTGDTERYTKPELESVWHQIRNMDDRLFFLIGGGQLTAVNDMRFSAATMYSQIYQNLMNLLKYKDVLEQQSS
ncbi:MAG: hypothetical protein JNL57_00105 [Bacteroidetes bacterium]|nr:hypothetical protein [Bacteroidota bacterium]